MMAAQHAHGPDGHSILRAGCISLGHQLLKMTIEDGLEAQPLRFDSQLTEPGSQPMLLAADARINNREALAGELGLSTGQIADLPDSAFVLQAWQRWGQDCVQHLVGAFAFAVWDANSQQLFLARDHVGERPLYFCRSASGFAFATTACAILTCPGVSAELDETTLARDLIDLPPEPFRTPFRDVRALAPGHCLLVSRQRENAVPRRYWNFDRLPATRFAADRDYVDAFLELFDEAVGCRLRTTGGIASHLSAGIDSGAVTSAAARLLANRSKKLIAYTSVPCPGFSGIIPAGCIADEGPLAAEVAALYPNIDHRLVDPTSSDLLRETARAFPWLERPIGAPFNEIWINLIFDQAARAGAKVLLTGSLGNATISYSGSDMIQQSFRKGHWLKALRLALQLRRGGLSSVRGAASMTLLSVLPWALRSRIDPVIRSFGLSDTAIRPDRARQLQLVELARRYFFAGKSQLPFLMETYFHTNMLGEYGSMSNAKWGIEMRDPTADKRVFEYCASIPMEQYLVGNTGRSLIKRAMRGRLPDSTLDRRTRGLQAADWYESLTHVRTQLAAEFALIEGNAVARRLLDLDRMRGAIENWPQSERQAFEQQELYQFAMPRAMTTGHFMRRCGEFLANNSGK
jgi:asparagine synthase (glutamine-hydrolysing)